MSKPEDVSRMLVRYAAPVPVRAEEDELDALAIVRLVRRRIWLIIIVAALVLAAALPPILAMRPVYTARSRVLIQNSLSTMLTASEQDHLFRLNLTTDVERLLSHDTSVLVIRKLGLDRLPEFNPELRSETTLSGIRLWLHDTLGGSAPVEAKPDIDPIEPTLPSYYAALSVTREPQSDIVDISFTSHDPQLAADVPNTVLDTYLDQRARYVAQQVQGAEAWLVQRIGEQTKRLADAQRALHRFDEDSIAAGNAQSASLQAIATLNAQRTELVQKRAELTAALGAVQQGKTREDRLALVDTSDASGLARGLQLAKHELDRQLTVYGTKSPEIVAAQAKLGDAEAAADAEIDRYTRSLEARIAGLDRADTAAKTRIAAARVALSRHETEQAQRTELQRSVETEQSTLDGLESQRRQLQQEAKLPVADVEILTPATVPLSPTGHGRKVYLLIALVIAGVLGLTAACAIELLDGSVRSHQQLRTEPGLIPAGMVPALPRRSVRRLFKGTRRWYSTGMFAEAIRGIVMALEYSNGGRMPASVLVTSAIPREGKSLLSAALAAELAATGRRVLLVDADFRRGRLAALFNTSASPGLAEFVAGVADLDQVIRHHPDSGIDYIVRGTPNADARLDRSAIAELLRAAAAEERIVVIDSPPALASTDAMLLASMAERTLFAVRWGRTSRQAFQTAVAGLRTGRPDEVLVAINRVNPRRHALSGFRDAELYSKVLRRYYPQPL